MRIPWILALALVAVTVPAGAQQKNKVVVKPSHEEKAAKSGPAPKTPTGRTSNSQELQKLEQQTAKSATGPKNPGRAHVATVKTQHDKANPPIHFTAGTGGRGGSSGSANSSKSRVRTHGNKH